MFRWLALLPCALFMEALAIVLAPILPLFASREGWLPRWLWWFQTPDNPLSGDAGWREHHPDCYRNRVRWLIRNRAYGLKWTALAAPVTLQNLTWEGDPRIKNRHGAKAGVFKATMGPHGQFWQWKRISPIPGTGRCVMLNFGWLLDAYVTDPALVRREPRALFLFSPRIAAFHPSAEAGEAGLTNLP